LVAACGPCSICTC
jgi:hypothetical protein